MCRPLSPRRQVVAPPISRRQLASTPRRADLLVSIAVSSRATSGHRVATSLHNFVDAAHVFVNAGASLHRRCIGAVPGLCLHVGSINRTSMLDDLRNTLD
uniref:Uncharacterized protein n=1 Tax=Oryza meridionalis TaxID=40149 RepID=A0A0E0DK18_9ORYZ